MSDQPEGPSDSRGPHLPGLAAYPPQDQQAIGETLGAFLGGFQGRQADALDVVYAEDADWVNAFGTVQHGRAQIVDYLRGLFADHNFDQGQPAGPPQASLRRVTDDVAVLSVHLRIRGQGLVDGGTIDVRDNHSLHVLAKEASGEWRIVSALFMDARTDSTFEAVGAQPS